MQWYSTDQMTKDGWLAAGGTATCFVNWHWSPTPVPLTAKWAYIAVDSDGNDYFAEALLPKIKLEKLR